MNDWERVNYTIVLVEERAFMKGIHPSGTQGVTIRTFLHCGDYYELGEPYVGDRDLFWPLMSASSTGSSVVRLRSEILPPTEFAQTADQCRLCGYEARAVRSPNP